MMLTQARRLRIYFSESDRWHGKALSAALLETLHSNHLAGATLYRGLAGFGAHSVVHTARLESLSMDLPMIIETIDSAEKINAVLELIKPMLREGLVTLEDVEVIRYTQRYLNPLPADRQVGDVMVRDVVSLAPDMSVHVAWQKMLDRRLKMMPVVDPLGIVVGVLTDEDLLNRAGIAQRLSVALRMGKEEIQAELKRLATTPRKVEQVMTRPVITIRDSESVGTAADRMVRFGIKRLPVVNESGVLVGIISRLDVLRQVMEMTAPEIETPLPGGVIRTVRDVMIKEVPLVKEDDDLTTIVQKLIKTGAHRVIVVDGEGRAIGLITDSDVICRVQPAKQRSILDALKMIGKVPEGQETARDLMSVDPLSGPPDLPVIEAIQRMLMDARKWLVVVDDQGKPIGYVDRQRILEAVSAEPGQETPAAPGL